MDIPVKQHLGHSLYVTNFVRLWESNVVSALELDKNFFIFHGLCCHGSFGESFYFTWRGVSDSLHHLSSRWTFPRNAQSVCRCIYVYFVIHPARISYMWFIKQENKSWHVQGNNACTNKHWEDLAPPHLPTSALCLTKEPSFQQNERGLGENHHDCEPGVPSQWKNRGGSKLGEGKVQKP